MIGLQSDSSWLHGRTGVNTFKRTEVTLWPSVMFCWQADCLLRPHISTFLLQKGFKKYICATQTTHNCAWLTSEPTNAPVGPEDLSTLWWCWLYFLGNTFFNVQISARVMPNLQRPITSPHWLSCLLLQAWGSRSRSPSLTHILHLGTLLILFQTPAVLWASVCFGCRTLAHVCSAWIKGHILGINLNLWFDSSELLLKKRTKTHFFESLE